MGLHNVLILTIRTDKPEAEIGLYQDHQQLDYETWEAHRQLAETIHIKIQLLLKNSNKNWPDIQGIIFYKGPGSFTGLRIGAAVANALAGGNKRPIVGTNGEAWIAEGLRLLRAGKNHTLITPKYGAEPHTTSPRK